MSSGADTSQPKQSVFKFLHNQTMFMFVFLIFMVCVFSYLSPHFLSVRNFREIAIQTAVVAMLAAGQTFVILSAGIDLGMGSVVALSSVAAAMTMEYTGSSWQSFPVGLLAGAACGICNGIMVGKLSIPPFVATFGMTCIARGVALIVTGGMPQYMMAPGSDFLGQRMYHGVPVSTMIVVVLYVACYFILTRTKRGRYTYAVGSNVDATFLSGINVSRQYIWVYMMSGLAAGLAGITELSRVGSGQPGGGMGYELDSIASVVVGGTSMSGGLGSIWGTLVGALIITTLRNGLNVLNTNAHWQQVAIGLIVVLAVYTDRLRNNMRK